MLNLYIASCLLSGEEGIIFVDVKNKRLKTMTLSYPHIVASHDGSTFVMWKTDNQENSSEIFVIDNPFLD